MNMPTPETVTDAFKKFDCISLNTTQLRFIGVVRQQIAEVDVGLVIIACTMAIITNKKI